MSGVKRMRLADGERILQNGPKSKSIIMDIPQKDLSGFWHKKAEGTETMGGGVKAPRKNNVLKGDKPYWKPTPPPISNDQPHLGEGPCMDHDMMEM